MALTLVLEAKPADPVNEDPGSRADIASGHRDVDRPIDPLEQLPKDGRGAVGDDGSGSAG